MKVEPTVISPAQLIELKADLAALETGLSDQSQASKSSRDVVELDQQAIGRLSRMDALQNQAMAQASEARRTALAQKIARAHLLIEEDEYGFCQECGEDIPFARLKLDPTITTCVTCASGG